MDRHKKVRAVIFNIIHKIAIRYSTSLISHSNSSPYDSVFIFPKDLEQFVRAYCGSLLFKEGLPLTIIITNLTYIHMYDTTHL